MEYLKIDAYLKIRFLEELLSVKLSTTVSLCQSFFTNKMLKMELLRNSVCNSHFYSLVK